MLLFVDVAELPFRSVSITYDTVLFIQAYQILYTS